MDLNLNNQWVTMTATSNNQYAYYNTLGPWNTYFPLHIRVTSVTGETVDDYISSKTGGVGQAQFSNVSTQLASGLLLRCSLYQASLPWCWLYQASPKFCHPACVCTQQQTRQHSHI